MTRPDFAHIDRVLDECDARNLPSECGWCQAALGPHSPSTLYCSELHQQLWHFTQRGQLEQLVPALRTLGAALQRSFAAIVDALGSLGWKPAIGATSPAQRALELRRTRNTGPQGRRRAPRRIDPRRAR